MKKNCFGTMFWLFLRNDCIPGTDLSSQRVELFTSCPGSHAALRHWIGHAWSRYLIKMLKIIGPKIEPQWTPLICGLHMDIQQLTLTLWFVL